MNSEKMEANDQKPAIAKSRKGQKNKRSREEGEDSSHSSPAKEKSQKGSYSLEGTRYGVLEQKVKSMIDKQKKQQQHSASQKESSKQKTDNTESMHPNKKRRKFEKELSAEHSNDSNHPSTSNPEVQEFVNNCTVYIQGLPFTCEEQQIRDFFASVGGIKSLRVPRWHDSGKLKGYGHVEFDTPTAAQKALELNGEYLGDRYITVEKPMVPRSLASSSSSSSSSGKTRPPGCKTIFIRNLPYEVTEEEIRQSFMVYGPIQSVRLAVWNHTNNLKGFGYIEFKREDSAEIAVQKSGSIRLNSRIITVDYETAQPKRGYKGLRNHHHTDSSSHQKKK